MNGTRFLATLAGLLWMTTGGAWATPPRIVTQNERLFGSGSETYAVLRTVSDNQGSHYVKRVVTTLVERSKGDSAVVRETLMLDREEIVDASYTGPGKVPVNAVIHAKDQAEILGNLLEKWPDQGYRLPPEELARFKVHSSQVTFDDRLSLFWKPALTAWQTGAPENATWTLEEGIDFVDTILLKLGWKEQDGDSSTFWICVDPAMNIQVRAYRDMQDIYLVAGTYDSKDQALEQASKWIVELKTKGYSAFKPAIWTVDRGRRTPDYVIVAEDSKYLIDSGATTEVESHLNVRLVPMNNSRMREWVPIPRP